MKLQVTFFFTSSRQARPSLHEHEEVERDLGAARVHEQSLPKRRARLGMRGEGSMCGEGGKTSKRSPDKKCTFLNGERA